MPAVPVLTGDFGSYRNQHSGETVLVCGCGVSLGLLGDTERLAIENRVLTIGVNDIGRFFTPDYLVVVNERRQFAPPRYAHVEASQARAVFTPYELAHPRAVRFRLGRRGGFGTPSDRQSLDYSNNSPFVAVNLARHLGACRIGLIGVDFTEHHFFGPTGHHALSDQLPQIDRDYAALAAALRAEGIELVNLSPSSRLTALPRAELSSWLAAPAVPEPQTWRIVSYATTPVAGVPAILARCIDAATRHTAACVWAGGRYGNGVSFTGGIDWRHQPREALALLEAADVVIVHNGKIAPAHQAVLQDKPVVTLAHNYGWNVDLRHVQRGLPGLVVGQYQATLPEFEGWGLVPNPVPLWEPEHAVGDKGPVIRIAYTPSGRHERYPSGHRLVWHGKGWDTTMAVLHRLAVLPNVQIETTEHGQVSHDQALAMKRRAHIVIDECVTGSYHRNSLEGLAAGAVVINAVGLLQGVPEALRHCAPDAEALPFEFSTLDGLEHTLLGLIGRGSAALAAQGRENRVWMERHWDFAQQWSVFWSPACAAAMLLRPVRHAVASRSVPTPTPTPTQMPTPTPAATCLGDDPLISVVVPHGGRERLPQLATTLATLRQQAGRVEIIVVEQGTQALAAEVARRWADKHLFIRHGGAFDRARALNAALPVASGDVLLWHDNDLLMPQGFLTRAVQEMRTRGLDYLIPYTTVRYLSDTDTPGVMQGILNPADCTPVSVLRSGTDASGGMGLVQRHFLQRHGGLIEGFRGWGGEDNAWNHKVRLLGRSAPTLRADQHVHHLHHPTSGGLGFRVASEANPHYAANLELLQRVCAVRQAAEMVRAFPPVPLAEGTLTYFDTRGSQVAAAPAPSTVWVYWEGPCPDWIQVCLRTLRAAAPRLCLLTPQDFDRLRDQDRDIDLTRLRVAHRADYVRLFLLHRFGGLWIDADCLVMHPLQPVLDLLAQHDMVGHRERSGLASNGFLAARAGSRIIGAVYRRVCDLLRLRRPLGWTSLGSEPLSAVIAEDDRGWHELPCERVQPVCWSDPGAFFAERSAAEHALAFDPDAICYMLSNTRIRQYLASHPRADLLRPATFFSHLTRQVMQPPRPPENANPLEIVFRNHARLYQQYHDESLSGPGSTLAQTRELRERLPLLLGHLDVHTLLDAPCGDFHWMSKVELGVDAYIGVDILSELVTENSARYSRPGRRFVREDLITGTLPRADAIFCRDFLPHLGYADLRAVLENFRRCGATYLITTTFTGNRPNRDTSGGDWRTLNINLPPFNFPPALLVLNEKCGEGSGQFIDKSLGVWRLANLPL